MILARIDTRLRERLLEARLRRLPYDAAVRTGIEPEAHLALGLAWLGRAARNGGSSGASWSGWLPASPEAAAHIRLAFRDARAEPPSMPDAPPEGPRALAAAAPLLAGRGGAEAVAAALERGLDSGDWRPADRAPAAAALLLLARESATARRVLEAEIASSLPNGLPASTRGPGETHDALEVVRHTEALFDAHAATGEARLLEASAAIAERLLRKFEIGKRLPARFDASWNRAAPFESLTALARLAVLWFSLFRRLGDVRHGNAALNAIDLLCVHQTTRRGPLRGALKSSHPLRGEAGIAFPVEATAFLARALALRPEALDAMRPAPGSPR